MPNGEWPRNFRWKKNCGRRRTRWIVRVRWKRRGRRYRRLRRRSGSKRRRYRISVPREMREEENPRMPASEGAATQARRTQEGGLKPPLQRQERPKRPGQAPPLQSERRTTSLRAWEVVRGRKIFYTVTRQGRQRAGIK